MENSSIPVIKHYKGVCTVYVDKAADPEMAEKLVVNAKCQRPSVCNAAENLIVHKDVAESLLPKLARALVAKAVDIRASEKCAGILDGAGVKFVPATEEDFSTEYIDLIISVDIVDSVEAAADFINKYGSGHSDLIVSSDVKSAEEFLNSVDSSTVY